ncbi:MAG: hypothetical protein K0S41_2063 [Anaerocolumna sp.]|jgi:hypothetical protein|nr:hypothetical protein [Anaerocolumna sp.]
MKNILQKGSDFVDRYAERINLMGTTQRERQLNRLKQTISSNAPQSLSCKDVKIGGVDRKLIINDTKTTTIKDFTTLPNETVSASDSILWNTKNWLITEADSDSEVYVKGKIKECNYTLKFQHPTTGAILSYPCITSSTRLGQEENSYMTLGNNEKSILLAYNQSTILCGSGKRFFVDNNTENPIPYIVIGVDNTSHNGLIELIVKEDRLQSTDNIELGICNYFTPIEEPEPVDPEVPTRIVTITSDTTNYEVKLGLTYTFSVTVTNELGVVITNTSPIYSINNTYIGKVVLTDNGNGTATIKVEGKATNLLGSQFTLQCMDMVSGFSSSILFTIVGLW